MRIYPEPIKGHGRDAGLQLLASSVVAAMLGFLEVFFVDYCMQYTTIIDLRLLEIIEISTRRWQAARVPGCGKLLIKARCKMLHGNVRKHRSEARASKSFLL